MAKLLALLYEKQYSQLYITGTSAIHTIGAFTIELKCTLFVTAIAFVPWSLTNTSLRLHFY